MDVALAIAGVVTVLIGLGHETLGLIWVLPRLPEDRFPATPFGSRSMTASMVRVTWHIVTVFAVAIGSLLTTLAVVGTADVQSLLLRWLAVMWLVATAMALVVAGRRLRSIPNLLRLPVPLVWTVLAALCWTAAG